MATIKPFKALRPHIEYAPQVASKPYDVLSSEEARKETEGNLLSFLHVTKAEIDLPADVDVHSDAVYSKAKENLAQLNAFNITEDMLDRTGYHKMLGTVTLRQLLASWVVHDLTHIHQLSRVMAKQYDEAVGPWKQFMGVLGGKR